MNLQSFKHIVWDWNGTLLNDAWLCIEVMNTVLRRRRLPLLTPERYMQIFDFPVINYYRRLGFDLEKESFEKVGAEFMEEYERRRHEARLQAGARAVLESVHGAGLAQSVLSAYRHSTLEEILRDHDVRDYFEHVVGADDIYASGKVGQGRMLIERLGLAPGDVAIIGDTVHDFEVAREIGCACFLIPSGNHTRERLESCGMPVLDSLEGLA